MKPTSFITLLFAVLLLGSCYRDDPEPGEQPATCLYDPENIVGIRALAMDSTDFYLLENYRHYYDPQSRNGQKSIYDSLHIAHQPMTYRDLRIFIQQIQVNNKGPETEEYRKWNIEKSRNLCISEREAEELALMVMQKGKLRYTLRKAYFFTAMVREGTTIVANRDLFGLPAGTDLSSHFVARGNNFCLPQGSINEHNFLFWYDEAPVAMSVPDYFAMGTWLQACYVFRMKDFPEEVYDEITFTIKIPLTNEYWREYFVKALPEVRTEECTLQTSCTVRLGEVSTFVQDFSMFNEALPLQWLWF